MQEITIAHAPVMYELNLDPEVLKYTGDDPFPSLEATTAFIQSYDQYREYQVGRLAVHMKDTGTCIGWCGLKYDAENDEYDVGFRFFRAYWQQGYATETAKAAIAHGFDVLKLQRIVGRAMVDNHASIRVLQKIGMQLAHTFDFDGHPGVVYEAWSTRGR